MIACFFIPSIALSIPGISRGFVDSSFSDLGLRYDPDESLDAVSLESEKYVLGGRGDIGAVDRRRIARPIARLLSIRLPTSLPHYEDGRADALLSDTRCWLLLWRRVEEERDVVPQYADQDLPSV